MLGYTTLWWRKFRERLAPALACLFVWVKPFSLLLLFASCAWTLVSTPSLLSRMLRFSFFYSFLCISSILFVLLAIMITNCCLSISSFINCQRWKIDGLILHSLMLYRKSDQSRTCTSMWESEFGDGGPICL